jgi:acetyl esterase/lipase
MAGPGERPGYPLNEKETKTLPEQVVRLWPGDAPGALGKAETDVPTVTVYEPEAGKATGASVVVCPGGGYGMLADHEGAPVARWLNTLGVTGFVLKYRLGPRYRHPVMHGDVGRALRLVRTRASEWKLDPGRVGVLGFSAGGHLASTAATHFDDGKPDDKDPIEQHSSRPNIAILIYPVVTLAGPYAHAGSRENLLGKSPSDELVRSLSNETRVTKETPPTFLVHTHEDGPVPAENSLLFALALRKAGVPVELHLYERGPHGFGLGAGDPVLSGWPAQCAAWLKGRGFLTPTGAKS